MLANKIILNEEKFAEEININEARELTPSYFYESWKNSFENEEYKKCKNYKSFIKKNRIKSLDKHGQKCKKVIKRSKC